MIKEESTSLRRKLAKVREGEMARLRALGVPDSVIGRKFDISKQRVGQILGPRNGRS